MSLRRGPSIVTDGLVFYVDAANTKSYVSGNIWKDLSKSQNNGTLINNPTFNPSHGGSIELDGVNDYVVLPNTSTLLSFGSSDFSVFTWTYISSYSRYSSIIGKADATAVRKEWALQVSRQTIFRPSFITTDNTGTWSVELNSPNTLNFNQWYNIGVSRIGSRFDLYINGVSVANTTNNITILPNSLDTEIGRLVNNSSYDFNGRISNSLIYKDRGLTSTEVLQNYNALKGRFGL